MRFLCAALLAGLCGLTARAEDWTVNGRDYHHVIVGQVEGGRVHITYDGGIGTVALADLPPELQKRFASAPPQAGTAVAPPTAAKPSPAASRSLTVKIGGAEIRLCDPPGLVAMPPNNPLSTAVKDLTPADCLLLRSCISPDALDAAKTPDPSEDIMTAQTLALKDAQMDIDYGNFIDFVQQVAVGVSHGILAAQDSAFDDAETKKRLDQFQKDTGVGVKADSDVYSLGLVSRSDACVAFLEAQYVNLTYQGKTKRKKSVSVVAYILLRKKVVIAVTSLTKDLIFPEDLLTLKQAAEKYQLQLQTLNNL